MHSYTSIWMHGQQMRIATCLLSDEVKKVGSVAMPMVIVMYCPSDYAPYSLITWER